MQNIDEKKMALAIFVAPLATPIIIFLYMLMQKGVAESVSYIPVIIFLYGLLAYLAECFLGLPLFLLFQLWGLKNGVIYFLGGALIGTLTAQIIDGKMSWQDYEICGLAGALSATVFWGIVFGQKGGSIPTQNI